MRGPKNSHPALDFEFLHSILHYNPDTGVFTWKKRLSGRSVVGEKAGFVNRALDQVRMKVGIQGVEYMVHRLAWFYMTGEWPPYEVDHIDLDGTNNRWSNLRLASPSQNQRNRHLQRNNTSGYKGVHKCKRTGKFMAYIKLQGKRRNLGMFGTAEEAHGAYVRAANDLHQEFARV